MIDADKVKRFWEGRAATYEKVAFESVANLEQDAENLKRKIDEETAKVFSWLPDLTDASILDLGAGVGQWSFRFADRGASRVLAVEYAEGLAEIGRDEAERRGAPQVEFIASPAEKFQTEERFDLVFISGLFVYLTDAQAEQLLANLGRFVVPGGTLMLRDGTGIAGRHEIDDQHSEHLGVRYSATYRTRDQLISMMESCGLKLLRDENVFPEGHSLNKYPDTRLRIFLFRKG